MDLADLRDIVIIVWGILFSILLIVLIIATLVLLSLVRGLVKTIKETLETDVKEALEKAKETAVNVKGASEFMTDTTVAPVIRVYSAVSGAKQFVKTLTGKGRKKRRFGMPIGK